MNRTLIKLNYYDIHRFNGTPICTEGFIYFDEIIGAQEHRHGGTFLQFKGATNNEPQLSLIKKPLNEVVDMLLQVDKDRPAVLDWRDISYSQADYRAELAAQRQAAPPKKNILKRAFGG